ncbi:hypothetical protein [Cupriavidus sp. CuC1]|uniref:hypothetical protein n=1 Tax=Cupriavidus sp. CuC1 TaxID=3373131 RepID=UPI0037D750AA
MLGFDAGANANSAPPKGERRRRPLEHKRKHLHSTPKGQEQPELREGCLIGTQVLESPKPERSAFPMAEGNNTQAAVSSLNQLWRLFLAVTGHRF